MKSDEAKRKKLYVERDISWMYFNQRILLEAARPEVPLLEQLTFLGIYSNNLDEFFRVRVATLNRIVEYDDKNIREERDTAARTLKQIGKLHNQYYRQFEETFASIMEKLKQENIHVIKDTELTPEQEHFITSLYRNRLNGSTNPLFLTKTSRHTDDQTDEDIYLAIRLLRKDSEGKVKMKDYAVIGLPTAEFGRFIRLPDSEGKTYLMFLDDVIRYCLPMIFIGMNYTDYEAYTFKFTKDAEMEIDSDLRTGVLQKISKGIKSRKRGEPIRFVYDKEMPKDLLRKLTDRLNVDKNDTRVAGGRYHNFKDLMKFPDCGRSDLKYPAWPPVFKQELNGTESILRLIRKQDRSLHYPYQSFDTVIRVLREAAISKEVKSIKMTLYRLAKDSKVVKALICAAQNGKKVTVIIELLARFDEASNISWSKRMQEAGIKVIFGVEGLKIHSKLVHIGTRFGDLACISTGNFHEGNARMYTDFTIIDSTSLHCEGSRPGIRLHREALPPGELQGTARVAQRYAQTADSPDQPRNQEQATGKRGIHPCQSEPYYRPDTDTETLRSFDSRCTNRPGGPGQLLPGDRHPGSQRQHPDQRHHRPLSGTSAHLHLRQWRGRKILYRIGRLDAPQSGQPHRSAYACIRQSDTSRTETCGLLRTSRHSQRANRGRKRREQDLGKQRCTFPLAGRIIQIL